MTQTLLLLFHPDLSTSTANAALARAAATIEGVEVVDMYERYPGGHIRLQDQAEHEAQRLLAAERIVLQFPIHWYSSPPLLKAWQDAVLTRMYYIHVAEGAQLAGTSLMVAASAGNVAEAYQRSGANYYSLEEIFTPLKASAHRCGLPWHEPYLLYAANRLSPEALSAASDAYVEALRRFIG